MNRLPLYTANADGVHSSLFDHYAGRNATWIHSSTNSVCLSGLKSKKSTLCIKCVQHSTNWGENWLKQCYRILNSIPTQWDTTNRYWPFNQHGSLTCQMTASLSAPPVTDSYGLPASKHMCYNVPLNIQEPGLLLLQVSFDCGSVIQQNYDNLTSPLDNSVGH